ncbi:hypothetical protein Pmani_004141 [Petrolisthes manimaculis]|uniref:EGF-like domain-containing protein n=1 Tax=Petrolisthes manimaculis TaxID=1843537 RepID=A0AAE1UNL8_9EUCA|nr:hypothetical protein Pmani_004141 [Petrolisthes manimaculis]
MTVLGRITLALALSTITAAPGADHEVQQVQGPHVVKHEVGPLMEVTRNNKREAGGCVSCSLHGSGSTNYDGGYSTATYGTGGLPYPQSTSSRQEFRSEQQYVNGQPVYNLHHERRYQDGRLVHDRRVEEDEDDLGYPAGTDGHYGGQSSMTRSGSGSNSRYGQGSQYPQSGSHTSGYSSSSSQERFSNNNYQDEYKRMQEDLRRQMFSQTPHQPTHGGSHRSEQRSETRYINGKPVYEREEELNYQDGQLVMNRTEEHGPDDLGTEDVVRRYDSSGALITGSSSRGHHGSSQDRDGQHSTSSRAPYPGYTYTATYPSYSSWQSWSSWSSGYPGSSSHQPSFNRVSDRHREETDRRYSSSYPSNNPTSGSSSTSYREEQSQHSSSSPSYRPTSDSSSREEEDEDDRHFSSHPSYRPTSGSSSSTYREDDHRYSSSYPSPSYRPSSGSSSISHREEESRYSSSYPSNRPVSGSSSTTHKPISGSSSFTTYRPTSDRGVGDRHYSSHPSYRPSSTGSSTTYRREESQHSSSYPYHGSAPSTSTPSSLDVLPVRQDVSPPSVGTRTYHHTSGHSMRGESDEEQILRPTTGYRADHYREYERRRNEERRSSSPRPVVGTSSGGARTVTFDLSSPSSTSGSSFTDHLLQPNHSGRRHDTWDDDLQQRTDDDYEPEEERVGIPAVINSPSHSSTDDVHHRDDFDGDEYDDSQRYDISPHVDGFSPTLPTVDNEIESGPGRVPNPGGEDTDSTEVHGDDDDESTDDRRTSNRRPFSSGSFTTTYRHQNSHPREYDRRTGHSPSRDNDQHRSQTFSHDESRDTHPVVGSSTYHYNETNTRTSVAGGHQQHAAIPGQLPSTPCSHTGGCVISDIPQSVSRRTEIRTMRRYVNGHLVGITTHERQFENGELVNENRTDYDRDEMARMDLGNIGNPQMDLTQGTYHPESYSQQHEVRTEKKFMNGEQVHEVNHERRYEDGALVFDNLIEKDEDDFEREGHDLRNMGLIPVNGGDNRQQVTQTHHHHRQQTSGREVTGGMTPNSHQDHRTPQVAVGPNYSSRRYESRQEQEFIDGQPVYNLHHERHFEDGSLVHENRTEQTEDDLAEDGYHDDLHNILSGNTLITATQAPHHTGSHYGGSEQRTSHSRSSHTQSSTSYGGQSSGQASGAYGDGYDFYGEDGNSYNRESEASSGSVSSSLLNSRGHGSGRATTTVLGGSGFDSQRRSSFSDEEDSRESHLTTHRGQASIRSGSSHHDTDSLRSESRVSQSSSSTGINHSPYSTSGSTGSRLLSGNHGSGRASTTILGGSGSLAGGSHSARGTSSQYDSESAYDSQRSVSQTRESGGSGCLTCVLMGHTHDSNSGGAGVGGVTGAGGGAGAGGYSHRREMNVEEHYEDGRLLHGHHESREFKDGQLVHQQTRQYPDMPETQGSGAGGQGSHDSSHYASSSYSSSSSGSSRVGSEVCSPNPCHNGGTCLAGVYSAICTCRFGFSGSKCEELECPRGYCRRGGTCSVEEGRHVCTCTSGYEGPRCQRSSSKRVRRHTTRPLY